MPRSNLTRPDVPIFFGNSWLILKSGASHRPGLSRQRRGVFQQRPSTAFVFSPAAHRERRGSCSPQDGGLGSQPTDSFEDVEERRIWGNSARSGETARATALGPGRVKTRHRGHDVKYSSKHEPKSPIKQRYISQSQALLEYYSTVVGRD